MTNLVLDLRHRVESHPNCGDNHKEDRDQRDHLRMKIMMVTMVATTLVLNVAHHGDDDSSDINDIDNDDDYVKPLLQMTCGVFR